MSERVTVLYVGGSGRSGSTLLDNMLGQLDGFFSCGELRYVWERGRVEDRPCGCGQPFSSCPVWQAIMAAAFPDGEPDPRRMMRAMSSHLRTRHLLRILRRARAGAAAAPDEYEQALDRLYRAVAAVTGARVVVDSSKLPPYGAVVARLPSVDFFAVHLVRDSRATAYSWSRKRPLPDFAGKRLMQRHPTWKAAWLWAMWNTVAEILWRPLGPRYLRLRYEELAAAPRREVCRAAGLVGEVPATLPFTGPSTVRLTPTHSVAGNPSRFAHGDIELRPDTEWIAAMPARDRWLVTAMTWPLLRRYGYPRRGSLSATRHG